MAKVKPTEDTVSHWRDHQPHSSGPEHYWALLRSGEIQLVSRALRQCEIGAVRGDSYLCNLISAAHDPHCCRCHTRSVTT